MGLIATNRQTTVGDLIDRLQSLPRDKPIAVYVPQIEEYIDIQRVDVEHSQVVIEVQSYE